jgi:hypothetical protein
MEASRPGIAGIGRTEVVVATIDVPARAARAARADVAHRAGVAVVTGFRVVRVDAARGRIAAVVRAEVRVVAVERRRPHADAAHAHVDGGAGIAVVAHVRVLRVRARTEVVADVVRTGISVVGARGSGRSRAGVGDHGSAQRDDDACYEKNANHRMLPLARRGELGD